MYFESTFFSCPSITFYLTKFNKRRKMKAAPKRRHEAEVSCDPPIDSTNGVNADVAAEAPLDVSQNHLKPPKQSRDPRHKMDYAIFVIDEVYDARKAEQLGELLKQTLNELFDHYSLLSGVSQVQKEEKVEEMEDIETGK
ncbi:hypothetical protein V6N12_029994 [Hibiscus sabdariffa]|uniref:Uncharacterized protein n=1 Tax=Hibiscus sabdariffa TaxID=183260 RepID=A0ABR1Z679_9ROSI